MRATFLALTLLPIASPLFAVPLPNVPNQISESHGRAFLSHDRTLSSISRPPPQHLLAPHFLPVNAPHTPNRPIVLHTFRETPASDSSWALFTPRKPCHDRSGLPVMPKELRQHWSETRPSSINALSRVQEVKSWKITSFRMRHTRITYTSILSAPTFEHIIWASSALLVLAMGVELVSLWRERSELEEEEDEESGRCECWEQQGVDEEGKLMEKGRAMKGEYWRLEDEDTDVDSDSDSDLDENGMERSSW